MCDVFPNCVCVLSAKLTPMTNRSRKLWGEGGGWGLAGKSHSHHRDHQAKVKRSNFSCTNPKNQNQRLDSACTVRARAPMMVDLNYESSPYIRRHSVLPRRGDNLTKIHSRFLYFSSPKIVVPLGGVISLHLI